jgi:hypothetical protein
VKLDGAVVAFCERRLVREFRLDFDAGDARRERVFRNVDLRFWGTVVMVAVSRGSEGSEMLGCDSSSFV